jgi:oligopeptide/dipeptide ABC transporter ATP-binding protein
MSKSLLRVRNLHKHFPIRKGLFSKLVGTVKAVDGVSFDLAPQETLGLVGESGCGKTTVGRTLLRLIEPTAGEAYFEDKNIFEMDKTVLRETRKDLQIIFQDPYSSLNPRMTVGSIIGDALEFHGLARGDEKFEMAKDLLERVGLQRAYAGRYPHEFSGGQRQRIGIARAIALRPKLIVCDEAVSALDVSVQAQVINLLEDLQEEYKLSYVFIAHDLAVVRHISDRVAVMYLGRIVEMTTRNELYSQPLHPYTQALLSAIPVPKPGRKIHRTVLRGEVPNPINPPSGCHFHPRCPVAEARCKTGASPLLQEVAPGHQVACHLVGGDTTSTPAADTLVAREDTP